MEYGNKRDYRKIDIFTARNHDGKRCFMYSCSTSWAKTCREAIDRFISAHPQLSRADVKARFNKTA